MKSVLPLIVRCCLLLLMAKACANPAWAQADALMCGQETALQEKLQHIPTHLLEALSLVESGHWDAEQRANLAWPWTVNAEGEGRFLPSKQAAIAEVRRLQARGVRNIDVGCMQVNLLAHPDAFATLDDAFEPHSNVTYAGRFLNDLYRDAGDWPQAAAHYHSQTAELAAPYKSHLVATWEALLRHGATGGAAPLLQLASLDAGSDLRLPLGVLMVERSDSKAPPAAVLASASTARPDPLGRSEQDRLAAKQAADAYRQAKILEYRQKHGGGPSVGG